MTHTAKTVVIQDVISQEISKKCQKCSIYMQVLLVIGQFIDGLPSNESLHA